MQLTQLKRTANQREAGQSSWVELCRYKRGFRLQVIKLTFTYTKRNAQCRGLYRYVAL